MPELLEPGAEGRPAARRCGGAAAQGPFSAGVVTLLSDYAVCKEGDVLTPEQARVLVRPPPPAPAPPSAPGPHPVPAAAAGGTDASDRTHPSCLRAPPSFTEAFRV